MNNEILRQIKNEYSTPCYAFDLDVFEERAKRVKEAFGDKTGLCYSIKANPFVLGQLPEVFDRIEVCSPGELEICKAYGVNPQKIIFSGVNKTQKDIENAFEYGVGIFTAESALHLELINNYATEHGCKAKVILRLAHGSQFGIDESLLAEMIKTRSFFKGLDIIGLHYFTGTMKTKAKTIQKELASLEEFIIRLKEEYDFLPEHIEYGTGLGVEYYKDFTEQTDLSLLEEAAVFIREFASKYPLTVEMGRFFAAECGCFMTNVMDIKTNSGVNYVICDGGINMLNYYGQNMAMKVPPVEVIDASGNGEQEYCLCGSLCTTADILVRKVSLPALECGDTLVFKKCGAYSVCEGIAVFLSRALPAVVTYSSTSGIRLMRPLTESFPLNTAFDKGGFR